jgi:hypothetical protein
MKGVTQRNKIFVEDIFSSSSSNKGGVRLSLLTPWHLTDLQYKPEITRVMIYEYGTLVK